MTRGPEDPPGFVVRTEAQKAAFDNGFRVELGVRDGWFGFTSTTASGEVWISGASPSGPWFLSLDNPGVVAELGRSADGGAAVPRGPGIANYVSPGLPGLYELLDRAYRLGVSLPDAPLGRFRAATKEMPRTTEAERVAVQRIGQNVFREALLDYWGGRCPLTGITDTALLRASHIVAWAECEDDGLRLDVHNGLLLSALWDAAFDAGLLGFADDGTVIPGTALSATARHTLGLDTACRLDGLTDAHRANLARHRRRHGH